MGPTAYDAGLLITVLDTGDPHHAQAREALTAARKRGDELVLPASVYAEGLVSPSRRGPEAVATTDQFIDALPARVEPVSRAMGAAATALRATHGRALRLPDALVVATGRVLGSRQDRHD